MQPASQIAAADGLSIGGLCMDFPAGAGRVTVKKKKFDF
jgi:hypothetical protein